MRTFVLSISLCLLTVSGFSSDPDSTTIRQPFIIGFEVTGPVIKSIDNSIMNIEGYLSYRIDNKKYLVIEPGYASFSYSQYNYEYETSGYFLRAGLDINLIKPKNGVTNHFAGFSFRYGLSLSTQATPSFTVENYWGKYQSSIPSEFYHSHFLEIGAGVKGEVFRNILIGWSVKIRVPVYNSAGKANQPVYIPGVGNTGRTLVPAIEYWMAWVLPFKKH